MDKKRIPIACTLTPPDADSQLAEWSDLRTHATNVERLPAGLAMSFPASEAERVADLAAREATCCAFLTLETTVTADTVRLEITSDQPDALPVIELLGGVTAP